MNQRVKLVIKELKKQRKVHTNGDFAEQVSIGSVQLSELLTGKRKISEYYINKILTRFPEINEVWLRTGEGEMLKNVALAENQAVALAADEIKDNKISVNTDQTIALLVAELAAQRRLAEKIIDQNGEILLQNRELLAMVKDK